MNKVHEAYTRGFIKAAVEAGVPEYVATKLAAGPTVFDYGQSPAAEQAISAGRDASKAGITDQIAKLQGVIGQPSLGGNIGAINDSIGGMRQSFMDDLAGKDQEIAGLSGGYNSMKDDLIPKLIAAQNTSAGEVGNLRDQLAKFQMPLPEGQFGLPPANAVGDALTGAPTESDIMGAQPPPQMGGAGGAGGEPDIMQWLGQHKLPVGLGAAGLMGGGALLHKLLAGKPAKKKEQEQVA